MERISGLGKKDRGRVGQQEVHTGVPVRRNGRQELPVFHQKRIDPIRFVAGFYQNSGHILIQNKNFDLAKNDFQIGITKDWSNLDCHFGLAMAYIGLQDLLRAKKSLEDVLRIDPKNKKAGELLQQVGKTMQQTTQMNIQIQGGSWKADPSIKSKNS